MARITVMQEDIDSAARGLGMLRLTLAELRELIARHESDTHFAGQVIAAAAQQMLTARLRMGAREE